MSYVLLYYLVPSWLSVVLVIFSIVSLIAEWIMGLREAIS